MNILIINLILHTAEKGVIPRHQSNHDCMIYTMARGFVANGHKVTLIASEEYKPSQPEKNDFEVIYFASKLPKIFKPDLLPYPKWLKKWLKNNTGRFDLIISSETFSMGTFAVAQTAPEKTVIWQELAQHQRFMKQMPSKVWYNFIARNMMKKMRVIGRSERARDFIRQYLPKVSDEIVDHGCDAEVFHPQSEVKPENAFIIISQLIERKQPVKILEAFLRFIEMPGYDDYKLHVVGRGPLEAEMRRIVAEKKREASVIFHGFLSHDEFAPLSRSSRAMLVNTQRDLNMVSIPESIANGTPVLMNTVPYSAKFVNDNKLGMAVDDWEALQLAEMAERYEEFHKNCVAISPTLTNNGCAKKIVDIAKNL